METEYLRSALVDPIFRDHGDKHQPMSEDSSGTRVPDRFGRSHLEQADGTEVFQYSKKVFDQSKYRNLVFDHFHNSTGDIDVPDIFTIFISYLKRNPTIASQFDVSPAMLDLLNFEYCDYTIRTHEAFGKDWNVPANSRLRGTCSFLIGEFSHDVLSMTRDFYKVNSLDEASFQKQSIVLFTKNMTQGHEKINYCEISAKTRWFLEYEHRGRSSFLPDDYNKLIDLGVC